MSFESLSEWNRLNKENTIHDLISTAYQSLLARTTQTDLFCTWLLAGSGAVAAIMVTNAPSLFSIISKWGFKSALTWLVISMLFGILAKFIHIFFQYGGDSQANMLQQIQPILDKYFTDKSKIEDAAKEQGATLETDIDLNELISTLAEPLPWPSKWVAMKYLLKHKDNRQIGYLIPIKIMLLQSFFCLFQSLTFLGFIIQAARYAARA